MAGLYDIDFLRNVVLTDLINAMPVQGSLRGAELLPDVSVPTRKVEWERVLGGRNIAPIVAHDAASPLTQAAGVERLSAEAVDIRQKFFLDEDTLLFLRQPGERESRAGRNIVTGQMAQLRGNVESRFEKMRWDALLTGEVNETETVDGETLVAHIDFRVPAAQFVDASDSGYGGAWTTPGTADPKLTFSKASKTIREATGRTAKFAWMNSNTHETLDAVSGLHTDFRNQESAPDDLVKAAHVTDIIKNVRIIDYDEGFYGMTDVNATGTFTYYLPDSKVLYTVGSNDRGEKMGDVAISPARLADGSVVDGMYAEAWTLPDPTRDYIRVGKNGVPRLFHPDWNLVVDISQ
jgi:hypothetical protein